MNLRDELRKAIKTRDYLLSTGKSRRSDPEAIRRSIDKALAFLDGYPYASDDRVGEWCRKNLEDACRIVAGNNERRLGRLIQSELSMKAEQKAGKVIEMQPTDTSAA